MNSADFSGHPFYGTPPVAAYVCYYCNTMSVLRLHIPASASIHEETNIVFFFLFSFLVHLHVNRWMFELLPSSIADLGKTD